MLRAGTRRSAKVFTKTIYPLECIAVNMVYGFVMVQSRTGMEQEVWKKLRKLSGVTEVHPLFGEYDFLLRVTSDDPDGMARMIVNDIRTIEGVLSTKTLLAASFGPEPL